jgi:putative transcriptional regulator
MDKRKKNASGTALINARVELLQELEKGRMELPETIRRMRAVTGLTQFEYAGLVKVAPRVLIDLERGVGNPTIDTVRKIVRPFGLELRLMPKKTEGRAPVSKVA